MKIRLSGVIKESIVDGPGLRFTIFSQGCNHNCFGCHNPQTHDINSGYLSDTETLLKAIKENPLLSGVTFSGGEPFLQAKEFSFLAKEIHKLGLNIITYTGFTIEQLIDGFKENPDWKSLLKQTDTLIDGPFVLDKRSLDCNFRGSTNQRIIDPQKTILLGHIVEKNI